MDNQTFMCKCGKMKGWLIEGQKTKPCPKCGRVYIGVCDSDKLQILPKEIHGDWEPIEEILNE